jgi:N-methylhydantoinase A/oxoprolinase/acetone carboxylase beta subunit
VLRVGVDTGGTFTDVAASDGRILKVLSSPDDPAAAVVAAMGEVSGGQPIDALGHGTTVATNALLERQGAAVALVTTEGFADVIEIGRQDRPSLYDLWADRPAPLVGRSMRLEVAGRLGAAGEELAPVAAEQIPDVPAGTEAVAVCLLHADLDDGHERLVAATLRERGLDVSASHEVSPEYREYERTVTTVVNAYLRPRCRPYLQALGAVAGEVGVLTSAGGLVPVDQAADRPAALLLSGPAGGVLAGAAAAVEAGFENAVTFDMGGTSTDVCLIRGGAPEPAAERLVAGFPIRLPSLDVHTIGAGGGSLAAIDPGGALQVGPRSAGARPGPACYGLGGTEPTVTDADLIAGRLPADLVLPGLGPVDGAAAAVALDRAGISAEGVIAVVDAAMTQAVRRVTVERGVDPRDLALVAFGGAGPVHACSVAEALGMAAVIIPPRAGVLSAVGILGSPRQADVVRSWPRPDDHRGLEAALVALADEARHQVAAGAGCRGLDPLSVEAPVSVETAVDCRYRGQSHELTVPTVEEFPEEHRRRNGYVREAAVIEVVALRARAWVASPVELGALPPANAGVNARLPTAGPVVLGEPDCTVWVAPGWQAAVSPAGSWILRRGSGQ